MVRAWAIWTLVVVGCRPPDGGLVASCAVADDNALRVWCEVDGGEDVVVRYQPVDGGAETVQRGVGTLGVSFLEEETTYEWTVERVDDPWRSASGTFTTGTVPDEARETWTVDGASSVDYFLHVGLCAEASMAIVTRASDGATVWYERFPDANRFVGLQHSEDDTVLAVSGKFAWSERTWMGEERAGWTRTPSSNASLHHDVTRWDGLTYALTMDDDVAHDGAVWRIDGFIVFDGEVEVARWSLADHWLPSRPHPRYGTDVSHVNSIQVVGGEAVLSIKHLSTVIGVAADPEADDFGTVRWRLEGTTLSDGLGSDFALVDEGGAAEGFVEQHHASFDGEGRLRLFDNRIGEPSRGLTVRLDDGQAVVEEALALDSYCVYQGSNYRTGVGSTLLACGTDRQATEWADGERVWEATGVCATGTSRALPRMIPLPQGQ